MNTITSFYKKGLRRGFTLIELLVVIAIIGLLSTIIAAPITQARKKGRDGKKVADIRQMVNALQQYADDNNSQYPYDINSMVPKYLSNIPPNAASATLAKDKYMYVVYGDTGIVLSGVTTTIGFHLGSKMEAVSLSLKDDRDCMGVGDTSVITASCVDIASVQSADQDDVEAYPANCGASCPNGFANWVMGDTNSDPGTFPIGVLANDIDNRTGTASSSFRNDFSGGYDDEFSNCDASTEDNDTSTTTCVYDVTN